MRKKIKLFAHRYHSNIQFSDVENPYHLIGFVREPIWDIEKDAEDFIKETKIKVAECQKKMWKEINDMDKPRNITLVWEKSSMTGQECWHVKCDFYGHYEGEKINFIERQV